MESRSRPGESGVDLGRNRRKGATQAIPATRFHLKSITAATSATLFFCVATKIVILPLQPVTELATTLTYHSFDANLGEKTADFSAL
ncbi:hypothetical protein H6F98_00430 [Microcoleus sp. FACHB-SPT15]|uniref:hypothetical protein n=1 Tax=Microcoleus sp. FACHB-SPT15 TaxID=2692830 RepID=UPI001783E529|nr:hypothetical protein [Microcoleus sp. FACHB-SPT15]MBD1803946.1 hypothetical protein [Microcoleus sp. FACHB-SPT15]